jgi:hypothetical protein
MIPHLFSLSLIYFATVDANMFYFDMADGMNIHFGYQWLQYIDQQQRFDSI